MKQAIVFAAVIGFFLAGCSGNGNTIKKQEVTALRIYDINVKDMDGKDAVLSEYKGKVILIVNTATHCGFTPQYPGLQALYAKYKGKGFEILDFPCNQFLGQAPEGIQEYHNICTTRFGVTFRQFTKIDVNGENESPLYTYLKKVSNGRDIGWNFTKFLIDREGKLVRRFESAETPESMDPEIAKLVE